MSKRKKSSLIVPLLIGCCFFTLGLSLLNAPFFQMDSDHESYFRLKHLKVAESLNSRAEAGKLAGLSCDDFGGPRDPSEMVFWSDIPADSNYASPLKRTDGVPQYLLFEPDGGGWNNIRMSMETILAMSHAMGRTLVLPPEQRMYLLGDSHSGQRNAFSFMDFFPLDSIAAEHKGLDVITMDAFLEREGLSGNLKDSTTGKTSFPPNNFTNWNGMNNEVKTQLNPWIRSIAMLPNWDPQKCVAAFPKSRDPKDVQSLYDIHRQALGAEYTAPDPHIFVGHPTPVDAGPLERLKESLAARDQLCVYDTEMQNAPVVHFHGKKALGARILVHFYAFIFFEDWRQDLWTKRFVRDHVRYIDKIQCAAARIVQAVRERARSDNDPNGDYDAFHIRRGDFQYKGTRIPATEIFLNSHDLLTEGSTVYIGTDERNKSFFAPLAKHYNLLFLDDFVDLIPGINTNYYGMLDQIILSRSRRFFGCWFSTFTGYINRIRGYHSEKLKLPGYEDGVIESYYYALVENKMSMREYSPVKKAFHAREFPASWRSIDKGIEAIKR